MGALRRASPSVHIPVPRPALTHSTSGSADSHVWAHVAAGLMVVRMLEQIGGGSAGGEDLVEGGECD